MKITFIRPSLNGTPSSDAMEPLVFAILAGLTPPEIELVLYDERLEPIPYEEPTDLVALTVETFTARRAYQIAAQFRQRGVAVVMGGYHPTFVPEEAQHYADAVVIGDAEGVWEQLVQDAKMGKLQPLYKNSVLGKNQISGHSLAGLKFDRRLFQGKKYLPINLVQHGRGCRFACDFCSISTFYGSQLQQRPVQEVVAEIESLNKNFVFLIDDNIFVNESQAEQLFRALIPLKIRC